MKESRSINEIDADPIDDVTRSSINRFIADFDDHKYDTKPNEALKKSKKHRSELVYTAPLTTVGFYHSTQITIDEERSELLKKIDAIITKSKANLKILTKSKANLKILAANEFISNYYTGKYKTSPAEAMEKLKQTRAMLGENGDHDTMRRKLEIIENRLAIKLDLLSGVVPKGPKKP